MTFRETARPAPESLVKPVEFGAIPEQVDSKEVMYATTLLLIDLKSAVDLEIRGNPSLSEEDRKKLDKAQATFFLFFHTILGADQGESFVYNANSLRLRLEDIPENVFRAWDYLCDSVPEIRELLLTDQNEPNLQISPSFDKPKTHIPYLMFQKALREMSGAKSALSPKDKIRDARVKALLDTAASAHEGRVDRSIPYPVNLAEATPLNIEVAIVQLDDLLEERKEDLPADIVKDVEVVRLFLRRTLAEPLAREALSSGDLSTEERKFFEKSEHLKTHPRELNLSHIPSAVVEACARIGMIDPELHLAFIGHDTQDFTTVLDAQGRRSTALERRFAYQPFTIAANNTMERDRRHLAGLKEMYRLDDLMATPTHGGILEVVSAADFVQVAGVLGTSREQKKTGFAKAWNVLTTPIGDLFASAQRERREDRLARYLAKFLPTIEPDRIEELIFCKDLLDTGKAEANPSFITLIDLFRRIEENEELQIPVVVSRITQGFLQAARGIDPAFGQLIKKELEPFKRAPLQQLFEQLKMYRLVFMSARNLATSISAPFVSASLIKGENPGQPDSLAKRIGLEVKPKYNEFLMERMEIGCLDAAHAADPTYEEMVGKIFQKARRNPGTRQAVLVETLAAVQAVHLAFRICSNERFPDTQMELLVMWLDDRKNPRPRFLVEKIIARIFPAVVQKSEYGKDAFRRVHPPERDRVRIAREALDERWKKQLPDLLIAHPEMPLSALLERDYAKELTELIEKFIVTEDEAQEILGNHFYGKSRNEAMLGFDPTIVKGKGPIPTIPFSAEELVEARERGERLILRIIFKEDGSPLLFKDLMARRRVIESQPDWVDTVVAPPEFSGLGRLDPVMTISDFPGNEAKCFKDYDNYQWFLVGSAIVPGTDTPDEQLQKEAIEAYLPGSLRIWKESKLEFSRNIMEKYYDLLLSLGVDSKVSQVDSDDILRSHQPDHGVVIQHSYFQQLG